MIKQLVWFVISTAVELLAAFLIAGVMIFFFNLSGIPALASLGYWQLYWLQMAIYWAIESPVMIALAGYEYFSD